MKRDIEKYKDAARGVLDRNWTGSYTMPARGQYPHQWNWDSGFIAIGYSRYDTERAVRELKSLFRGQWRSGMLPQIVFSDEFRDDYFPGPDFWQSERSPLAPRDVATSGITMPPVHAMAALRIYENAREKETVLSFLEWIYPRLIDLHRYLYRERDPEGVGLVYIRHPWESGMDNSPMWDRVLGRIDLEGTDLPAYERKDTRAVSAEQRPDDAFYNRFVYLADLFRKVNYDEAAMRRESPFLVYGPLFNSILAASNEALVEIAEILGRPTGEQQAWLEATNRAIIEKLFHAEHGMFDFYDLREGRLLEVDTAAGFMPLFSGAATEAQARRLYETLDSKSFCALHEKSCFSIPNYDRQKGDFDRKNYWRGPIWININWLLMHGLRRYGFRKKFASVAMDILELVMMSGFCEYFDSFDGRCYGARDFSWTAALFIDTAEEATKEGVL